jgi:predicted ATP-dependent endonuclease of OLD family
MESIRIENLRSLKDTRKIPLKAINLLLGPNNSGKSTFLRVFPLLKQSIEARTRGPILWYGDYVDFGDFSTAVNKDSSEIIFHFDLSLKRKEESSYYEKRLNLLTDLTIHIGLNIKSINDVPYINKISLGFKDQIIEVVISTKGKIENLNLNGEDYSKIAENYRISQNYGLIPRLYVPQSLWETNNLNIRYRGNQFIEPLFSSLKRVNRKNTSSRTIRGISINMGLGSKEDLLSTLRKFQYLKFWQKQISNWDIENENFIQLNNLYIGSKLPELFEYLDDSLHSILLNFYYIAPIRATAQRYYRRQDLAVTQVDFQGQNLAMFIDNMSDKTLLGFQGWLTELFGFYPYTKSSEGHISLRIVDSKTKEDYNISDRGFGFSQLLPVLTLLWSVATTTSRSRFSQKSNLVVLAIEQPELHLHPELQAKLTDAFIKAITLAQDFKINLKLIIETHSSTIVNRLGHLIADGNISKKEATIILFETTEEIGTSKIRIAKYNDQGFLENWPIGFFEPKN